MIQFSSILFISAEFKCKLFVGYIYGFLQGIIVLSVLCPCRAYVCEHFTDLIGK